MVRFLARGGTSRADLLRLLPAVQEEIYRQLCLLFPDALSGNGSYRSCVAGSPVLRLDVLERHRYTTFLRLTYEFGRNDEAEFAPDAHVRAYHDAATAEVTSFSRDQGLVRTAHPGYPAGYLLREAWRLNRALDRWLDYLLHQGHSALTMRPIRADGTAASTCAATVEIG